jgi:hypothetical protein
LRRLITDASGHTRDPWPDIRRAYGWVHRAARILDNAAGLDAAAVGRRLAGLIAAITRHRAKAGTLAGAVDHFLKVTRSYRPGLFHGYAVAGGPAAHRQRPRAAVRSAPPPRAAGDRPQDRLTRHGAARPGAARRGSAHPATPL